MKKYKITLLIDQNEYTSNWCGYTEQVAIAQAFLSYAQSGARKLEVLEIEETGGNITCECGNRFYGLEGKEDTCSTCLKEIIQ